MPLPFDHAVRNLGRRPSRTLLTAVSSAMVAALLVGTVAFVRGLERTFSGAADPHTAMLLSSAAERDVVRSTTDAGLAVIVTASVPGVVAASDEIHMGTSVGLPGDDGEYPGFVRGVTLDAYAVHRALTLVDGRLPGPGEVIVGPLVARQMGVPERRVAIGSTLIVEGGELEVVGHFVAPGTTLEAEMWTPLEPLRGLARRDDSSCVYVRFQNDRALALLELFCDRRLDLELEMITSEEYFGELTSYLTPIQYMAWALAVLVAIAALLGGANTAIASIQDRLSELAALRAVGFGTTALAGSLLVESLLIAAAGAVAGLAIAQVLLTGSAVRLAMSAFELRVDAIAVLAGFAGALLLAMLGVVPAWIRLARTPIAAALVDD